MTVRVAFIGAGGIAQWQHFDNVEAMDDVEVVAVCDVDEATAREAADRFDAAVFTDHRDLYDEAAFDAVFVCLPPFAHEDQEVMAAERGIHLFVEKPLALSNEKAREIRDAVEANGVVAQVGHNWRYSGGLERAADLLEGRTIGYVDGYWRGGLPAKDWWRRYDMSGGQVVEQATHVYDAVRYLAGDVDRVCAAGSQRIHVEEIDFPDSVSATMEHEDGIVSHVSSTSAAEEHAVGVEVVAEGATLTVTQEAVSGTVDGEEVEETFDGNPYRDEVEAFVEAIETGDASTVRSPYADAARTLALTLAVNESVEAGAPVALD